MLDRSRTIACLAATAMSAVAALAPGAARADTPHPFKSASIKWLDIRGQAEPMFVEHDGTRYTHVSELHARFRIKARVKAGHRIYGYIVTLGDVNGLVTTAPASSAGARNSADEKSLERTVSFAQAPTGIASVLAVNGCNNAFNELPTEDKPLGGQSLVQVFAGFSAGRLRTGFQPHSFWFPDIASGRPAIAMANVAVQIICRGNPAKRSAELPPKPLNVDIRVATRGATCPKDTEVTAYVDYAEKTTARIRPNVDGQLGQVKSVQTREVTLANKTWHRAEVTFPYQLDPGTHKFRIEVDDGPKSAWKTVDIDCPPFKILSTWMKYEVEDKPSCPKKVVETVTFKATRPGTINYEIKHQGGLVVHKGQAEIERQGEDYVAVATRNLTMSAFDGEMMAEVKNSSANSGWVPLKVECQNILGGTLDLRDLNGQACPREAEAAFSIKTNMPGPVPYQIDCTAERSWSGTVEAQQTAADTFIAVGVVPFAVNHDQKVNCALKALVQSPPKILALRGRHYTCTKRAVDPAPGGLVSDPRPPSVQPDPPRVVVDPPRLVCVGGKVAATGRPRVRHTCHCPDRHTLTRTGPNSYRCEMKTVVSVTCIGGTAKGGHCVCAPSMRRIPAGANAWRCVPRGAGPVPAGIKKPGRARAPSRFQSGVINRFSQGSRDRR